MDPENVMAERKSKFTKYDPLWPVVEHLAEQGMTSWAIAREIKALGLGVVYDHGKKPTVLWIKGPDDGDYDYGAVPSAKTILAYLQLKNRPVVSVPTRLQALYRWRDQVEKAIAALEAESGEQS
jgi:hypothetical protein